LSHGAALLLELDSLLFDPDIISRLKEHVLGVKKEQKTDKPHENRALERPVNAWLPAKH
jgi:hypothetical protein